jgi:hypothetical protein
MCSRKMASAALSLPSSGMAANSSHEVMNPCSFRPLLS